MLYWSGDGNYHLQRKNKNTDPDDKALNDGHAYFVQQSRYEDYLRRVEAEKEVSNPI